MPGAYFYMQGPALEAFKNLNNNLLSKAKGELGQNTPLITRQMVPEDVELDSEDSSYKYRWWSTLSSTGATANTMIDSRTIADNRFIGIYGVTIASSDTASQIEVTRKGSLTRKWNVQSAGYTQDNTLYFDDPFTCDQNTTLKVEVYASSAAAEGSNVIFHGITVEKKGLTVNP